MPYNERLAARVREMLSASRQQVEEKKMFSGLCFMVNDKMCVGVHKESLMVRLNPALFEEVLEKDGCVPMEMTG